MLSDIKDVTERVKCRGEAGHVAGGRRNPARRAIMNAIEQESSRRPACAATSSRSIRAASIHLYRYKKYTDVRLVFAPRKVDRLLRRRSGQLRVPALRPRHLPLPRLRERQAAESRALLAWSKRRGRQASWFSSSAIPGTPIALNTVADLEFDPRHCFRDPISMRRNEVLLRTYSERKQRKRSARAKDSALRRRKQPQGPSSAASQGCRTRPSWPRSGPGEKTAAGGDQPGAIRGSDVRKRIEIQRSNRFRIGL